MLGIAIDGGSFEKLTGGRLPLPPFVESVGSVRLGKQSLLRREARENKHRNPRPPFGGGDHLG
jgi:hypothetical protein